MFISECSIIIIIMMIYSSREKDNAMQNSLSVINNNINSSSVYSYEAADLGVPYWHHPFYK